ncbi:hypothetical protein BB559_004625 [Furculomyces boomerangus]|uniref:Ras-related protein Rab-18 n=1 Tax=Furculomyces boomerangus TaxID=61424 RepID=A0A2T9YDM7_9FUNG|nr:hypothetical protein BB559_004625 [Furculomyces boomerangus]
MSSDSVATFKILMIGDSGVGKSSILLRFTDDNFLPQEESAPTIGDTAGQEKFRTLTSSYYRGAQGVVLVYDVCDKASFEHLDNWFEELNTYCTLQNVVKIIIGNKIDKEAERVVSRKEGAEYARQKQTLFLECSAKTKIGVQQAIEELIIETPDLWDKGKSNTLVISDTNKPQSECYC